MPSVAADPVTQSSMRAMKAPSMNRSMAMTRSSLGLERDHGHGIVDSCTHVLVSTTVAPNWPGRFISDQRPQWALQKVKWHTPVPNGSAAAPCNPKLALSIAIVAKPYALCQLGALRFKVNAGSLHRSANIKEGRGHQYGCSQTAIRAIKISHGLLRRSEQSKSLENTLTAWFLRGFLAFPEVICLQFARKLRKTRQSKRLANHWCGNLGVVYDCK